jgi:hypothetical protein
MLRAQVDAIVDGVELDDAMQLQMFEVYGPSNSDIRAYDCHIAPKGIPPMLIRPEGSYVETDVEVNGRQRIDVLIDFTSRAGCDEICSSLKPGP